MTDTVLLGCLFKQGLHLLYHRIRPDYPHSSSERDDPSKEMVAEFDSVSGK
jgi:hypothetical protein